MTALLLCGYRNIENYEQTVAEIIERRIVQLIALGMKPVCVLSGANADNLLRACPRIADAELVFDTSETGTLASNLKAGLAGTDGEAAYVLPWEVAPPERGAWLLLRDEWMKAGFASPHGLVQAIDDQGAPWHFGFPLLVTRTGNAQISDLEQFTSLTDKRVVYLHVPYQRALAPMENPL